MWESVCEHEWSAACSSIAGCRTVVCRYAKAIMDCIALAGKELGHEKYELET